MAVNWKMGRVTMQLVVGTSLSSNGRERMVADGIVIHVPLQQKVAIFPSFGGREQMDVNGIVIHAGLQLEVGISPSSNGRECMDVNGIVVLVPPQQKVGISPSSNGRERMDVTGNGIHIVQLRYAATKTCSITLLLKGALDFPTIQSDDFCLYHSEISNFESL